MTRSKPDRFLVIAGSGIGNILLATPLMRSLRWAYPHAEIDVLTPKGRGDILVGNPDINHCIEVSRKEGPYRYALFFLQLFRHYDIALSARSGDRSIINAFIGGRRRYSLVKTGAEFKLWQKFALDGWVDWDTSSHAVLQSLKLADMLGIPRCYEIVPPQQTMAEIENDPLGARTSGKKPYAVAHLCPRHPYKCWTKEGWTEVFGYFSLANMPIYVTGGNDLREKRYNDGILGDSISPLVINTAGKLSLAEVSTLVAGCSVYIGPDTAITHLAAALGVPTVALFGPSNPVYWGPWPRGYREDRPPFTRKGSQKIQNVYLVQNDGECIGCGLAGCDSDPQKNSPCMQQLRPESVIGAIKELMAHSASNAAAS